MNPVASVHFSAGEFPEKERLAAIQEIYAPITLMDFKPFGDGSFRVDATLHVMPALTVAMLSTSPFEARREPAHAARSNDDLVLTIASNMSFSSVQRGGDDVTMQPGEAYFSIGDIPGSSHPQDGFNGVAHMLNIAIPRAVLAPSLADLDKVVKRKVPLTPHLKLFTAYAQTLAREFDEIPGETVGRHAAHIHDLAIMALGATRDAAQIAKGRGLRAARLYALKADIATNAIRPDLSVETLAARHGISPRYMRTLFNSDGTTFSDCVLNQRLTYTFRLLTEVRSAGRSISEIAFEAGFGDLSYFNRTFRRKYGMTPSDARATVR